MAGCKLFAIRLGKECTLKARLHVVVMILLSAASLALAQRSYDDSTLRQSIAERIRRQYDVAINPATSSLSDLLDLESRLSCVSRINRTHGILFDYRQSTLADLLDVEGRLNTAERLKKNYQIDLDYRQHSLATLLDAEGRISTASRIQQRYGVKLDWQSNSLSTLLQAETSLASASYAESYTQTLPPARAADLPSLRPSATAATPPTAPAVPAPSLSVPAVTVPSIPNYTPSYSRYYDWSYRPAVGDHFVSGYFRTDGTYVAPHYQTNSDDSFWNNWSSYGNVNPYTGSVGTRLPSVSSPSLGSTYVHGYFRSNGTFVRGHYRSK